MRRPATKRSKLSQSVPDSRIKRNVLEELFQYKPFLFNGDPLDISVGQDGDCTDSTVVRRLQAAPGRYARVSRICKCPPAKLEETASAICIHRC